MKKNGKNKKNKRNSFMIGFLVFLLIVFFLGVLAGLSIGDDVDPFKNYDVNLYMAIEVSICFCLSIYIQIIVHEGGHLIFGRLSGYRFVSFRIGHLMIINENGKIKFKKFTIVGTGGQCLMMPPQCDGYNYPCILYNLGGVIGNIVFAILCIILFVVLPKTFFSSVFFIINFIMGIGLALLNGIPLRISGIANDGYNTISLTKNEEARRAFWLQLHINGLISSGTRLRDMPEEWFVISSSADLKNPLVCGIGVLRCSYFNDKKEFDNAKAASEFMLQNAPGMLEILKNELRCELMFYEMIGECRKEEIDRLYTKELRKYIKATSSYVSRKRLMYAYELLVNKNEIEAKKQLDAFEKAAKVYPYKAEVESEREIIDYLSASIIKNL